MVLVEVGKMYKALANALTGATYGSIGQLPEFNRLMANRARQRRMEELTVEHRRQWDVNEQWRKQAWERQQDIDQEARQRYIDAAGEAQGKADLDRTSRENIARDKIVGGWVEKGAGYVSRAFGTDPATVKHGREMEKIGYRAKVKATAPRTQGKATAGRVGFLKTSIAGLSSRINSTFTSIQKTRAILDRGGYTSGKDILQLTPAERSTLEKRVASLVTYMKGLKTQRQDFQREWNALSGGAALDTKKQPQEKTPPPVKSFIDETKGAPQ